MRHPVPTNPQSLLNQTDGDLMTSDLVRLTEDMPLREAASLLMKNHVSGAPVVDRGSLSPANS
jgi:predicted transcriptional regulator